MFYKILRIIIIYILVTSILGFLFNPIYNLEIFRESTTASYIVYFLLGILVPAVALYLASYFLYLGQGESEKIARILAILIILAGILGIVSTLVQIKQLNYLSSLEQGSSAVPEPSYTIYTVTLLFDTVVTYFLARTILRRSEKLT